MIDWDNCQVTPPPLLSHVSSDDLMTCQQLILHQAVEQTMKDVSAFSSEVYGYKSQHGIVFLGNKARLELPKVDTKGSCQITSTSSLLLGCLSEQCS